MSSAALYAGLAADAQSILADFGWTVQINRPVRTGTQWDPTVTPSISNATAAIVPYTYQAPNGRLPADMTALGYTAAQLSVGDTITDGAITYVVATVETYAPGGQQIINICGLRR